MMLLAHPLERVSCQSMEPLGGLNSHKSPDKHLLAVLLDLELLPTVPLPDIAHCSAGPSKAALTCTQHFGRPLLAKGKLLE